MAPPVAAGFFLSCYTSSIGSMKLMGLHPCYVVLFALLCLAAPLVIEARRGHLSTTIGLPHPQPAAQKSQPAQPLLRASDNSTLFPVKHFVVNLDLPPEQRCKKTYTPLPRKREQILNFLLFTCVHAQGMKWHRTSRMIALQSTTQLLL